MNALLNIELNENLLNNIIEKYCVNRLRCKEKEKLKKI